MEECLLKDSSLLEKAKRVRWFGIDRGAKQGGIWENDIVEIGYKYQMTDVAAAMGLAALEDLDLHCHTEKSCLVFIGRALPMSVALNFSTEIVMIESMLLGFAPS